jgi:hypothetical protein
MTATKFVRFSDNEDSTSDVEPEDYGGFVTKRTFELLDQDEPFLQKHFKMLQQTASEHCEAWKENLKEVAGPVLEVVEPMKQNANRCVDCMVDAIHRVQLQKYVLGKPKTLAMVGGPAPAVATETITRDTKSLASSIILDEKSMKWVACEISSCFDKHSTVDASDVPVEGKPRAEIIKKNVGPFEQTPTMLQQIGRVENQGVEEKLRSNEKETSFTESFRMEAELKRKSLLEDKESHIPSGKRPESPIKLFSSQDIEEYFYGTDATKVVLPGKDSKNPIIVDDLDVENGSVRLISTEKDALHKKVDDELEGEERDQPPDSPIVKDHSSIHVADRCPAEFRRLEQSSFHSHLPLSKTLLFSMRSRTRDIENLLTELPTKYSFATSGEEDMSTDGFAAPSCADSKLYSTISQENSIDSTKDLTMPTSFSIQSFPPRKATFKLISFRATKSAVPTAHTPQSHTNTYRKIE